MQVHFQKHITKHLSKWRCDASPRINLSKDKNTKWKLGKKEFRFCMNTVCSKCRDVIE